MADEKKSAEVVLAGIKMTALWGNPAEWKAQFHDEALKQHLAKPIGERLAAALNMVVPRPERDRKP